MRKLWFEVARQLQFAHLARAMVAFPGGFGTLDELTEILTLSQTGKLDRGITVPLYGSSYWNEIIDFEALVRNGMIARDDLALFQFVDEPETALRILKRDLPVGLEPQTPAFARSVRCESNPVDEPMQWVP